MTYNGPNAKGADPNRVYADDRDHERQAASQEWTFVTPAAKRAESAKEEENDELASDESAYIFRAANPPPESLELFAQLPVPPKRVSKLKPAKKYPIPHPLMQWVRGVPMNEWNDYTKPAMNLPTDAQQFFAIHMDRVGLMHVDQVRSLANEHGWLHVNQLPQQLLRHWKPTEGPDIPINPGTWHSVDEEMPDRGAEAIAPPDLSGVSDAEFAALKEAVRREEIRKKQLSQADVEAQERAAAESVSKRVTVAVEKVDSHSGGDRAAQLEASTISTAARPFRLTPTQTQSTAVAGDAERSSETPEHRVMRERVKSLFASPGSDQGDSNGPSASSNEFTVQARARMAELKRSAGEKP